MKLSRIGMQQICITNVTITLYCQQPVSYNRGALAMRQGPEQSLQAAAYLRTYSSGVEITLYDIVLDGGRDCRNVKPVGKPG